MKEKRGVPTMSHVLKTVLTGWFIMVITYGIVLLGVARSLEMLYKTPLDLSQTTSVIILGMCLLTVPYLVVGVYGRLNMNGDLQIFLLFMIVPVVLERVFIYGLGAFLAKDVPVIEFIQLDIAPYFTFSYIIAGLGSMAIALIVAKTW
jgi:hypothetical protein